MVDATLTQSSEIIIRGAAEHNLKGIDLTLPKGKLIVFTGVSGSGKTSLAMDTIYAEGQRRYVESLSSYARQFLGVMKKPEVESIEGLSPAIAIDQKTTSHNPRSTVGTVTEIYDYFRLLFARIGHPHCSSCGREIAQQSVEQIVAAILESVLSRGGGKSGRGVRLMILAPIVKSRKGEFSGLLANLRKEGYRSTRVDGVVRSLEEDFVLIKTNQHTIEAVVDRVVVNPKKIGKTGGIGKEVKEVVDKELVSRLTQSVETAARLANGYVLISFVEDASFDFPESPKKMVDQLYSEHFACPECNLSLPEIEPRTFSFNSPHGACPECSGLGFQLKVSPNLLMNPDLSVLEGGFFPWSHIGEREGWYRRVVEDLANREGFSLRVPIKNLSKEHLQMLLHGAGDFEGLIPNLERRFQQTESDYIRSEIGKYMVKETCPVCQGARLKKEALSITIGGQNIVEVSSLPLKRVLSWVGAINGPGSSDREKLIAAPIVKEIVTRLSFLLAVGLDYLTLDRPSSTLAGGEAQRIRLASQIGSGLSGVLYVLDEPSIGLHARDLKRLIKTLKDLRDLGNTVLVVEHDTQTMLAADWLVDFGPGAGEKGGRVVAEGTPEQIIQHRQSLTGQYLSGRRRVPIMAEVTAELLEETDNFEPNTATKFNDQLLREKMAGKTLRLVGGREHNLKNIQVDFPLGKLICVTGVSGSGKSTLVNETLHRALRRELGLKTEDQPGEHDGLLGVEHVKKLVNIDQSPIGRTPRSNPATYTKTFDHIRRLFAQTPQARIRGYSPGRFSFNVKGGRCEACRGDGQIRIEMQFMPDVYVDCEVCGGRRYTSEVLEVDYKGKNIHEVLEMTIEEALQFFAAIPPIQRHLQTLNDVGLGYLKLGQPAPTLSGGEAQRVKLASELTKRQHGQTLYLLDEPTTGLHFADLENLLLILRRLVDQGNTVLVIEHNLDVVKNADWVIDLGPEGGDEGGQVIFAGPVEKLVSCKQSHTGRFLKAHLATN